MRLGELVDIEVGYAFQSADFVRDGYGPRLVRGDNIGHGSLRWKEATSWRWAEDISDQRYQLASGDLVLGMDRPWIASGIKFAVVQDADLPALLVQRVARLRVRSRIPQGALRYIVSDPAFASYIQSVQTGTAIPHISAAQIGNYPLPERVSERAGMMTDILGVLDDKIDGNLQISQNCDSLARAKFEALKDWGELPLSEAARFVNGKAFTRGASGSGRMVVRIAELNSGPGSSTVYNDIKVEDNYLARPGDILFSWSGSLVMCRWFYPEAIVNQHIFKVIPRSGFPKWLVAQLISRQLDYFRGIAADKTTTMGHIQRRHLDEPVNVPSSAEIAKYDPLMTALWERALAAEQESLTLAALRDTLLPALMSGRLSVRDAEAAVSEVV